MAGPVSPRFRLLPLRGDVRERLPTSALPMGAVTASARLACCPTSLHSDGPLTVNTSSKTVRVVGGPLPRATERPRVADAEMKTAANSAEPMV